MTAFVSSQPTRAPRHASVSAARAAVVARALSREQRRMRATRDVAILTGLPVTGDLDELALYGARQPIDLD